MSSVVLVFRKLQDVNIDDFEVYSISITVILFLLYVIDAPPFPFSVLLWLSIKEKALGR